MRRRAKASSAIVAICCGIVCCFGASPALAASKSVAGFFGGDGTLGGQFKGVEGVAVNRTGTGGASPGDVYVLDSGNNRVQQFSADGDFVRAFGLDVGGPGVNVCTEAASCTAGTRSATAGSVVARAIAIEQTTGNIYLANPEGGIRIDVFSATGDFEGAFGWNVNETAPAEELQFCTSATGCKQGVLGTAAGQFGGNLVVTRWQGKGVAVNPLNGRVVVTDGTNRRVDEFAPTLESGVVTGVSFVRGYGWGAADGGNEFQICTTTCHAPGAEGSAVGQFGEGYPEGLTVDPTGKVYVSDLLNDRVQAFSATATPLGPFAQAQLGASVGSGTGGKLAANPTNDNVLGITGCGKTECRVLELDSGGTLLETYLANDGLRDIASIAVGSNGDIYLGTNHGPGAQDGENGFPSGGEVGVLILSSSPPVPPHVTIEAVSAFTGTTATFAGHVNPESAFPTGYHFEYSADGSNWAKAPVEDVQLPGGNAENAVSVEVEGLEALTEYQVRLVGTKSFGAGTGMAETSFETTDAPPVASATTVSRIRDTSAILEGEVNPENQQTEYSFEYVDQAGFEANGFAGAASIPAPPGSLSGGEAVALEEQPSDLVPATTYHVRLTASNAAGTTSGEEAVFTTYFTQAEGLPDGRAYEQATPLNKNGGNINGEANVIRAASDGGAITYFVIGGAPNAEGEQDYPMYLASRSPEGWLSQGLQPPAATGSLAHVLGWSEDLSKTYSNNLLFGTGGALYQRDSATQEVRTIANGNLSGSESRFAGASDGGAQALFEAKAKLLPAAVEGKSNVYLWDDASGQLSLASVLNDGSSPAEGAFAGSYDWFFNPAFGETKVGGAAQTYYTQAQHAIAVDGSAVYFTAAGSGELYLRRNPAEAQSPLQEGECTDPTLACTIKASASRRTVGLGPGGADFNGPKPKAFMAASADGSKAFFTSAEQLTDDANTGLEPSIARASLEGTGIEPSFIPAAAAGIAVDGSHVYWANPSANAIGRANLDGSGRQPKFITGAGSPQDVAVDGAHLYWANRGSGADGAGTIGRANLDGTEPNQGFIAGASNPIGIAVDAEHLYWVNSGSTAATRRIARANVNGTEASQSFINPIVVPRSVAVNSEFIYFSAGTVIGRAKLNGTGLSTSFIKNAKEPKGVAVDGGHIYWVNASTNAIGRANLDGTLPNQEFAATNASTSDIAVDSLHLYWSSANSGDKGKDLYRYDAGAEELSDLSPDPDSPNGAEVLGVLGTSNDGSHVYFAANGVLTATPNEAGEAAAQGNCSGQENIFTGACNLYLWHGGAISFIAGLDANGELGRSDAQNWRPAFFSNHGPPGYESTARVSADGHTLLFRSQRSLTGYDNQADSDECVAGSASAACAELYRYDSEEGLACVSCNPTGAPPLGPATLRSIGFLTRPGLTAAFTPRNLSADGSRVFFETPDHLVAEDSNGDAGCPKVPALGVSTLTCQDVYEWEASGTGSCESDEENGGCLSLLSTGTSPDPSYFADASLSGEDAFFFTSQRLVAQDKDELIDIYDARAGGGIASQNRVEPVPCEGEACKGGASSPPAAGSPGTASFAGPGNPVAKHRKPHRKRRHSKKHRKHRPKSHRQARSHR